MPSSNSVSNKLIRELRHQIEANDLAGASLVVAVSGGPDSLALVHALHTLRQDLNLQLHVAHMDHGLRPEASEADSRFVREIAATLDIPLTTEQADVSGFSKQHHLSIEDAARRLRYRFLARVVSDQQAQAMILGHTQDDQAETVLMHIIRGSGLNGLRGMEVLSTREIDGQQISLFRPLLSISKSDTLAYCTENGLEPRLDESNLSTEFTRNRIRIDLLPQLEKYNPSATQALVRLASSASLDMDFIQHEVTRIASDVIETTHLGVRLDRKRFAELHPAIQHHLLRLAVAEARGDTTNLELTHVEDMVGLMSRPAGKTLDLPGDLRFDVDYTYAFLRRTGLEDCPLPEMQAGPSEISVPGSSVGGGWKISTRMVEESSTEQTTSGDSDLKLTEKFDADILGTELTVRPRKPGDTFQPLGMDSEKKLKDFMIDAHIPQRWRGRVPLIESNGRIAWVVGWRIADWAKITKDTQRVLEIRFQQNK